jgi:hypothetical protein
MDRLEDFLAAVRRLEKGREAYGDRTFELPASNIIIEAQRTNCSTTRRTRSSPGAASSGFARRRWS